MLKFIFLLMGMITLLGLMPGVPTNDNGVPMPALLENPWFLAILGWLLYNVGKLWYEQKSFDKNGDGLGWSEIAKYFQLNWIGMLFSLMLLPLVTPYTKDIWYWSMDLAGKNWPFSNLAYGFIGIVMVALQYGIQFLKAKFSKS